MSSSNEYEYAPILIPVTIIEVFVIVLIILYLRHRSIQSKISNLKLNGVTDLSVHDDLVITFTHTYQSFGEGNAWTIFLCLFRFGAFSYFLGVSWIWNYINSNGEAYYFFTTWNIELMTVYYFLAFVCSVLGLSSIYDVANPIELRNLTKAVHKLFQVCAPCTLFVTTVAFTFLNPEFKFWNVSVHFVTLCSFLVEMSLNSMTINRYDMVLPLLWAFLYVLFIWPMVMTSTVRTGWPYAFLALNTPLCFLWYSGLFLVLMVFYMVWYVLSVLKLKYFRYDLVESMFDDAVNVDKSMSSHSPLFSIEGRLTLISSNSQHSFL